MDELTPTPEQRRELLELEKKATPRPWHWEPEYGNVNTTPDPESDHILCGCCWHAKDDPDYLYAVAAANIAPGLVREVERLRESNAAKQKLLDEADVLIGQQLTLSETLVRYETAINAVYSLATRMLSEPPETIPSNTGELVEICTIIEAALAAGKERGN